VARAEQSHNLGSHLACLLDRADNRGSDCSYRHQHLDRKGVLARAVDIALRAVGIRPISTPSTPAQCGCSARGAKRRAPLARPILQTGGSAVAMVARSGDPATEEPQQRAARRSSISACFGDGKSTTTKRPNISAIGWTWPRTVTFTRSGGDAAIQTTGGGGRRAERTVEACRLYARWLL
jgi:hypothetical protein